MALSTTVSSITREKFIPVLVDNIYNSNVLCLKLLKNAEKLDGGKNIVTPVEYAKLSGSTSGWIDDGGVTATANEETVQKATWDWATGYVGLKIPGSEELVNKGSSQVISLLKSKLKSAEKKFKDMFGDSMFDNDGTLDANAITAAIVTPILPNLPNNNSAADATGVKSFDNSFEGSTPTITVVPAAYTLMAVIIARKTPSGRFFSGFSISSATLAIFVIPT